MNPEHMNPEVNKALRDRRKIRRELAELQQLKAKMKEMKNPDQALLAKIENEIKARTT